MPTVLITGAGRGLGHEFVRQYLEDGWHVIACARDPARVPGGAEAQPLDVTDGAGVARLAAALDGRPIDLLLNNAGVYGPERQGVNGMDYDGWLQTFAVNTLAPFRLLQALRPNLERGAGKLCVNITSRMGSLANMGSGYVAYRSSKAALNAAMRVAAQDLARAGLVIVVFHPGWVRTDMGGPQATLSPEESVRSLRKAFARLTKGDSGRFFDYDGSAIAW